MTQQLLDILSSSDHEQLKNYISSLVDTANISEFQKAFEHFISEAILPNVTKDAVISTFEKLKSIDDCVKLDFMMSLMQYCQMYPTFLQIVEKNKAEYIKLCTENKMLEELADFYVNELFDEEKYKVIDEFKVLEHYLAIAEAYYGGHRKEKASEYISKCRPYIFKDRTPKNLLERYSYLLGLLKAEFGDIQTAALTFYSSTEFATDNVDKYLRLTIIYSILCGPTPLIKKLIAKVLNNERTSKLPIYNLLKMFSRNIQITKEMIPKFEEEFKNEIGYEREKLLSSIQVHNLECISNIYSSISLERLSQIIDCPIDQLTPKIAMINSETVKTSIDQPGQMLICKDLTPKNEVKDQTIYEFCRALSRLVLNLPK